MGFRFVWALNYVEVYVSVGDLVWVCNTELFDFKNSATLSCKKISQYYLIFAPK